MKKRRSLLLRLAVKEPSRLQPTWLAEVWIFCWVGRVADQDVILSREQDNEGEGSDSEYSETYANYRRGGKERAAPPLPLDDQERSKLAEEVRALGGLYVLGTERHESRRIDNQLRGRAGRQGDPGESRFFVSLEDFLWKIFNAKMLENPLLKAWPPMEEVNAKFLSRMIQKTQERIEHHFFEQRKNVLEYDDVLNSQREHIYAMRREVLLGRHMREQVKTSIYSVTNEIVDRGWYFDEEGLEKYSYEKVYNDMSQLCPVFEFAKQSDLEAIEPGAELSEYCYQLALKAYDQKEKNLGEELITLLEQKVYLQVINDRWMDHLQIIDYVREGISLRGYGQIDPLVAYKRETYDLFQATLKQINDQAVHLIFRAQVQQQPQAQPQMMRVNEGDVQSMMGAPELTLVDSSSDNLGKWPENVDPRQIGRNDACPCGSGKKFKACHYRKFREEGNDLIVLSHTSRAIGWINFRLIAFFI
jgi:preprotein translocase subunit SecA